jgi:hypothetical protein
MAVSIDQQFVEYIVKSLVGKPEAVKVDRRIDEKGVLLELTVDPEDLGRVIGKRGSTAQSLRTLLRALGTKNDARYNLKIVDTGPPPERREEPAEAKAEKKPEKEPVAAAADEPVDQPSPAADDVDMADEDELPEKPSEETSDVVSRTRKELADLDDLDV